MQLQKKTKTKHCGERESNAKDTLLGRNEEQYQLIYGAVFGAI
jgi:hypothetical protein